MLGKDALRSYFLCGYNKMQNQKIGMLIVWWEWRTEGTGIKESLLWLTV